MKKNKPSKRNYNLSWKVLTGQAEPYILTEDEFRSRVDKNPWHILDFDIRYAIDSLREDCRSGTKEQSEKAKSLLKEVGLERFIPNWKSKPPSQPISYWKCYSNRWLQEVTHLEERIKQSWKQDRASGANVKHALKALLHRPPTKKEIDTIIEPIKNQGRKNKKVEKGYNSGPLDMALSCFMEIQGRRDVKFSTFRREYYRQLELTETYSPFHPKRDPLDIPLVGSRLDKFLNNPESLFKQVDDYNNIYFDYWCKCMDIENANSPDPIRTTLFGGVID